MSKHAALTVACLSGFAIMVLEIVGMRLLARDFGSSFYVWTSQIGVVLVALTAGYVAGGHWADRFPGPRVPALFLAPAGLFTMFIPDFAGPVLRALVDRHPADYEIPLLWQKLDPALGAALIFLPPCFVLAILPPFLIRLSARDVGQVGRTSGAVVGAGSGGSIAGVFLSGYLLMDLLTLPQILRGTGILILGLSAFCAWSSSRFGRSSIPS
ncbi:MAG: fused MFS/spermidine synthase [Limisphaerales bacterium]